MFAFLVLHEVDSTFLLLVVASIAGRRKLLIGSEDFVLGSASKFVGILNVTPDSFSDGGAFSEVDVATERALRMFELGAWMVDIGGESTRPGFEAVSASTEAARVVPVVKSILSRKADALLSVDTSKAEVAVAALNAGCRVVNDIWGFQKEPAIVEAVARSGAGAILMRNGRDGRRDGPVVSRILKSWELSLKIARKAGVSFEKIVLDPGIGFGTTRQEDLEILQSLSALNEFGLPVMLGASRKRVTAEPKGVVLEKRLEATLATTAAGIAAGIDFFRVHDIEENMRFADLADLIYKGGKLNG